MVRKMRGISLIEVLVVIAILVILLTLAFLSFNRWRVKVSIEGDVKDIYALVQKARSKAFSEKRDLTVSASGRQICIYEGTSTLECLNLQNPFTGRVSITMRGYFSSTGSIRYNGGSNVSRSYDCVVVSLNRVRMGIWNGSKCEEK